MWVDFSERDGYPAFPFTSGPAAEPDSALDIIERWANTAAKWLMVVAGPIFWAAVVLALVAGAATP
jgi:hypothetical protein